MTKHKTKTIGVILAAGDGTRFGASVPKQFTKLAGRAVLDYTIDVFEKSSLIDEIVVVTKDDYIGVVENIARSSGWTKLKSIVVGGKNRMESTLSALEALSTCSPDTKVLIHDAVRPFVTNTILNDCIQALEQFPAVDTVVPSSDTIVAVQDDDLVAAIPDRSKIRRGQTPQGFRLDIIRQAYTKIIDNNYSDRTFTCDCSVVMAMLPGIQVATVPGSASNIKITEPIDLFLAEKLIQSRMVDLEDTTDFAKLQGKRLVIFGGRSGIGKSIRDLALHCGAEVFSASRSENSVDVSDAHSVSHFLDRIAADGKQIDAVINTSGVMFREPLAQAASERIREMVETNYLGAINVATASRLHLLKSKGCLVNFSSSSYTRGRALYAVYSSTKAAIVNLSQALAEEWIADGIRVQCISPERTSTPMRRQNFGQEDRTTLLAPEFVAQKTLQAVLLPNTGLVINVRIARPAPEKTTAGKPSAALATSGLGGL